ncbi:hypothetical protein [Clostridium sp. DJ247]|uniref:hypothetical protein n=1 Tax=Clostridium sp. DJ247 TaxID=2726188 RepID=UPI001626239A|nr:hypothetical protein [Clostridium sp. DJ247]MBC2579702.1 hypothetical protein [Clostridium sp. DJ247]
MIGCAAERLLILLSEAYLEYLKNNSTSQPEIDNFERKVVKADKALKDLMNFINTYRIKVSYLRN